MDLNRKCADCGAELEVGFIPDVSMIAALKTSWHRGEPDDQKPGVKYDRSQLIAIQAFRCTKCGLLKLYGNPAESD